ncbi:uncharacterized protein LOC117786631 [Drosophila innubila]|uniref:uncharacterized protein LOC117786631 n=1 Tax=Drosophila innubila TaxID=198719 RepID=UPI00148D7CCD|nr:uncharacterized protein LOC117786631 [Drosophila innubila]
MEIAAKYCHNLEHIMFTLKDDSIKKLKDNLSKLRMVKEIEVFQARDRLKPTFNMLIKALSNLKSLRCLHMTYVYLDRNEITLLSKLNQLEELRINSIKVDNMNDLFLLLGHLRILRIYNTNITLDSPYNGQLQVLDINCLSVSERTIVHLAKLHTLKQLFCKRILPCSINVLVKMSLEQIYTKSIDHIDILRLVKECSSLNALGCYGYGMDKEFLRTLLDLVEARGFQPERPFCLSIEVFEIKSKLITQLVSFPNSKLLKIA